MPVPDETIHQSLRLKIMAALTADCSGEPVEFGQLKRLVEATDGNLGSHLATLEQAGYIAIDKDFVGKKSRTRLSLTPQGRQAFRQHVAYLQGIVELVNGVGA